MAEGREAPSLARLVSGEEREYRFPFRALKRSISGFDGRWARRLMRATKRCLSIPKQWQEPFVVWIARFA